MARAWCPMLLACQLPLLAALLHVPNGLRSFLPNEPPVLVDIRGRRAFEERHLAGSCHVPLAELQERMYELPPPGEWPLALIGSDDEVRAADELLGRKGWSALHYDPADEATWSARPHEAGDTSVPSWRPNSFLAAVLREVGELPASGVAIDVGCGSGRDAGLPASNCPSAKPPCTVRHPLIL